MVHDEVVLAAAELALFIVACDCDGTYLLPACRAVDAVALSLLTCVGSMTAPVALRTWRCVAVCAYGFTDVSV